MGSFRKKRASDPYSYAKILMRYRPRSVWEMRKRLSERFPDDVVEKVISELVDKGILDDERFALMFARSEIEVKRFGPRIVRRKLLSLGVDEGIVDRAIDEVMKDFDLDGFLKDLKRRFDDHRKIREYLYRRGFDPSMFESES